MTIFDPQQDFIDSKDVPCTNWVHALVRGGALHLNVAIRSNDIWYGFSGINAFEWSVVQEILAYWIGAEMGLLTFFASSFHLYRDAHGDRPARVVSEFPGRTCYEMGIQMSRFATPPDRFDAIMEEWFAIEQEMRSDPDAVEAAIERFSDPLLGDFLRVLRIYHGRKKWNDAQLRDALRALPDNDLTLAAYGYLAGRDLRDAHPDPTIQPLCATWWRSRYVRSEIVDAPALVRAIRDLHAEKSAAYGDSWKRRGEVLGVLANIARKVDRLQGVMHGAAIETRDESTLDTAVDLLVYSVKYLTYLADVDDAVALHLGLSTDAPYSDGTAAVDALLSRLDLSVFERPGTIASAAAAVVTVFEQMEGGCTLTGAPPEPPIVRAKRAESLTILALRLVATICHAQPGLAARFILEQGATHLLERKQD